MPSKARPARCRRCRVGADLPQPQAQEYPPAPYTIHTAGYKPPPYNGPPQQPPLGGT